MISPGYVADQVIGATLFSAFFVLFCIQLLVERKALFDALQLNETQRFRDYKAEREERKAKSPRNNAGSVVANRLSMPQRTSTGNLQTTSTRKKKLRVGKLQKYFHRLGLVISLLGIIRYIDPYSIHGIISVQASTFLSQNTSALLYVATIIGFLFPIHLVRVAAFQQRTYSLEHLGILLTVITLLCANIPPGLYTPLGQHHYLDAIFILWMGSSVLCVLTVFNLHMRSLRRQFDQMSQHRTDSVANFHKRVGSAAAQSAPPPTAPTNATDSATPAAGSLFIVTESRSDEADIRPIPYEDQSASSLPLVPSASGNSSSSSTPKTSPLLATRELAQSSAKSSPRIQPAASFSPSNRASIDAATSHDDQFARTMKKMTTFQIAANIVVTIFLIAIGFSVAADVRDPDESYEVPSPDTYSDALSSTSFVIVQLLALYIVYWYARMPTRVLFEDENGNSRLQEWACCCCLRDRDASRDTSENGTPQMTNRDIQLRNLSPVAAPRTDTTEHTHSDESEPTIGAKQQQVTVAL